MKKLTKREKILIFIMICVAIVFGLGYLIILPAKNKYDSLNESKNMLNMKKQSMLLDINAYDSRKKQNDEVDSKLNLMRQNFYPFMLNDQIDFMLTNLMSGYSLMPLKLEISKVEEKKDDSSVASDSRDASSSKAEDESSIIKMSATISATGSIENIRVMIDDIAVNSKLELSGYSIVFDSTKSTYTLDLTVRFYMLKE